MMQGTGNGGRHGTPSPKYTAEFRQRAVRLYRERGSTYAEIGRELGGDPGSVSGWVERADASMVSPRAIPSRSPRRTAG